MMGGTVDMEQKNDFLGRDPIGRLLWRMSLPAIVAQLINLLYNLVDRVYIGHMPEDGALALTGVGVCLPIIMIVSAFAALVSNGGAPRASMAMGKGDYDEAEKILGNSVALQIVISAVLTVLLLLFYRPLLLTFGASENTIGFASDYMKIYAAGTVFVQLTLGMNAFITAQGFARTGMLSVMIGAGCNIVLDPVLIYGFGMGVRGAATATVISQAVSTVWVLSFLMGKKTVLKIRKKYLRMEAGVVLPGLAWTCPVYHAGKRERDYGLLQCLAAQIRGRRGGGSHDDSIQCDAVFHASDAGTRTGRPADHKLQLRRKECGSCQKDIPSASDHKPVLFDGSMAFNHAVPTGVCNDFFFQRRADRIHEVGAPHLLRGHGYFRGADCMPDDIYLDRQCRGIDHRGGYA